LKGVIGELETTQKCVKIHRCSQSATHLTNHQMYHEKNVFALFGDMIESKEIEVEIDV